MRQQALEARQEKMNVDWISAIIFVAILIIFLLKNRKKVQLQKIFFPVIYAILYRTNIGLKQMDRAGKKQRELIRFLAYCGIGFAFVGMVFISASIIKTIFDFLMSPKTAETGMMLVLPGTSIPGIGYLSFWHWIIAIFILALVHEFSHGVVARAHNVEVKSSGFAFFSIIAPIFPAAFVEPDEQKLQKQPDIVQYSVFAAGPISNIALALIFMLIASFILTPIEKNITEPVGFSFSVVPGDFPAAKSGMPSGMVVTAVNGEPVTDSNLALEKLHYCMKPGDPIAFTLQNGTTYTLITTASPADNKTAYIGVVNVKNEIRMKPGHSKAFFWFKDLIKWNYLLNLFIGLANLLPLGIVDGGRMLQIALRRIIGNVKKADKIWAMISLLFLLLMVVGLIGNYGKKFGLF
jgi:membrane-associated protease RseP (regulator of RpoE activity)